MDAIKSLYDHHYEIYKSHMPVILQRKHVDDSSMNKNFHDINSPLKIYGHAPLSGEKSLLQVVELIEILHQKLHACMASLWCTDSLFHQQIFSTMNL